jgi:phosphohistidine phosphatase SixA
MKYLLVLVLGFGMVGCKSTTTIYLVRHAEKSAPAGNVPLSGDGLQRAETLKDSLAGKKISAVYTTHTIRTAQTALPTARAAGLDTTVYNSGDSLLRVLMGRKGKNYLVVGHSNTVPQMLRAIGLQPGFDGNIPDQQYDNLFEVTVKKKETKLLVKKYGLRND